MNMCDDCPTCDTCKRFRIKDDRCRHHGERVRVDYEACEFYAERKQKRDAPLPAKET